jgi:hypothetical protein
MQYKPVHVHAVEASEVPIEAITQTAESNLTVIAQAPASSPLNKPPTPNHTPPAPPAQLIELAHPQAPELQRAPDQAARDPKPDAAAKSQRSERTEEGVPDAQGEAQEVSGGRDAAEVSALPRHIESRVSGQGECRDLLGEQVEGVESSEEEEGRAGQEEFEDCTGAGR